MVSTRVSSVTTRRRNLPTIFDAAAAGHATTPATPAAVTQPAANTAAATFVAAVRTLIRTRIDEKSAKFVAKKCFGSKDERFRGNEKAAATIFTRMVTALHESFVAEDPLLSSLFALDDVTVTVRADGNLLLFSTLELLVHPASPASDWLEGSAQAFPREGTRVLLEFARKLLESEAPFQGTAELLSIWTGRPKQHFSSAAARFGDPPGQGSAEDDLMDILLALRKEVRVLSDKVNGKGFTPRAEKPPVVSAVESDFYATAFQHAIDTNDCDRFDALCGKPGIIEDFSATSLCVSDTVEKAVIDEYSTANPLTPTLGSAGLVVLYTSTPSGSRTTPRLSSPRPRPPPVRRRWCPTA
ncbi:hypothetical protein CYMTET_30264 [Cymbomonas tetramitiformis]|uniref:Uncharacterized protein n=1 Tax=Cymbomonas tetramitiformis TaxID=36881 RepID=A0AAE0FJC3_9CHLO|nr:hypothetical protein CYMTET_30264 [Cymbomonas tetramitiformis]